MLEKPSIRIVDRFVGLLHSVSDQKLSNIKLIKSFFTE